MLHINVDVHAVSWPAGPSPLGPKTHLSFGKVGCKPTIKRLQPGHNCHLPIAQSPILWQLHEPQFDTVANLLAGSMWWGILNPE